MVLIKKISSVIDAPNPEDQISGLRAYIQCFRHMRNSAEALWVFIKALRDYRRGG